MNAKSVSQTCAPALGLMLLAHTVLAGTTFYVKNGGNDNANGTSDGEAWATINRVHEEFEAVVNPIGPGDSVLFKCGDKWDEQLVITQSGSESGGSIDWITIGAYGSGNRPIIGYDEVLSGWSATGGGYDDVYEISTTGIGEVFTVSEKANSGQWADYFRVYSRKSGEDLDAALTAVQDQEGSMHWDDGGDKLYVHAFDDTDLSGTPIKTLYGNTRGLFNDDSLEFGAIRTNDESYIKIQNVHAVCQGYGIGGMDNHHILLQDCRVSGNYRGARFGNRDHASTDAHNITVYDSDVRHNGDGLLFDGANDLLVYDNTLSDTWVRVSGEDQAMIAFQVCSNVEAYGNDLEYGKNGIQAWSELGTTKEDFYIHHNRFHGEIDRAIYFAAFNSDFGGDLHFYHNVIWLTDGAQAVPQGFRLDAETASGSEPYVIYNNTIHASQGISLAAAGGTPINLVLKNNLLFECSYYFNDTADSVNSDIHVRDFNCYYPVNSSYKIQWGGGTYRDDFDDYVNDTGDQEGNSFDDDPDFLNDPPDEDDVKIVASGTADNAGTNSGAPFNTSTDVDFYGLSIGGQASVGASEGVSSP